MGLAQHLLQTTVTDVAQGQAHPLLPAELVPNLLLAFDKPDAHRSMLHRIKQAWLLQDI